MSRKTLTVSEAAKERFDGHKRGDESQTELLNRALDALEGQDDGTNTDRTQVPDDVLTEENIPDIVTEVEASIERSIQSATRR